MRPRRMRLGYLAGMYAGAKAGAASMRPRRMRLGYHYYYYRRCAMEYLLQ